MSPFALFVALLVAGVVCVYSSPLLVPLGALVGLVWGLVAVARGALGGLADPGRRVAASNGDPARVSYVARQSWADLALAREGARRGVRALVRRLYDAHRARAASRAWFVVLMIPHGLGLALGVGIASLLGLVVLLFAAVTAAIAWSGALLVAQVVRIADRVVAARRHVRTVCPRSSCNRPIDYPGYRCPSCASLHRDTRPWQLGVLRRRCQCGVNLRPLIVLGAGAQQAACPYCAVALDRAAGTVRDVVVSVLGATRSGKTSLVAAIAASLAHGEGGPARPGGAHPERVVALAAGIGTAPGATVAGDSDAYELVLEPSQGTAHDLQLHDPAGAALGVEASLDALRHLHVADSYFVLVDATSIPSVRLALEAAGTQVDDGAKVGDALDALAPVLVRLGDVERRGRAAVIITKSDVLAGLDVGRSLVAAAGVGQLPAWLDEQEQGAFVRAVRSTFEEAAWFACSDRPLVAGAAVDPVLAPVGWLLERPLPLGSTARKVLPVSTPGPSVTTAPIVSVPSGPLVAHSRSGPAVSAIASPSNPWCLIVLVDRSAATMEPLDGGSPDTPRVCDVIAEVVDDLLYELVLSGAGQAVEVAVIDHGERIGPTWEGTLQGRDLVPVDELLEGARLGPEVLPPAGSTLLAVRSQQWTRAFGAGPSRVDLALAQADRLAQRSRRLHPQAPTPVVLDLRGSDDLGEETKTPGPTLGGALHFILHVGNPERGPIFLPSDDAVVTGPLHALMGVSSPLPQTVVERARAAGIVMNERPIGVAINANRAAAARFLDLVLWSVDLG